MQQKQQELEIKAVAAKAMSVSVRIMMVVFFWLVKRRRGLDLGRLIGRLGRSFHRLAGTTRLQTSQGEKHNKQRREQFHHDDRQTRNGLKGKLANLRCSARQKNTKNPEKMRKMGFQRGHGPRGVPVADSEECPKVQCL